jgi:hypothetical protein
MEHLQKNVIRCCGQSDGGPQACRKSFLNVRRKADARDHTRNLHEGKLRPRELTKG